LCSALLIILSTFVLGTPGASGSVNATTPWASMTTQKPIGAVDAIFKSVSCPANAGKLCVAVGSQDFPGGTTIRNLAEVWKGGTWLVTGTPNPGSGSSDFFTSVSCGSRSYCMAVGSGTSSGGFAELWNGSKWSVTTTSFGAFSSAKVSCSSTTCLAVGQNASAGVSAFFWNGGSWSDVTPNLGQVLTYDVSCVSSEQCIVVVETRSSQSMLLEFSNGAWTVEPPNPDGAVLQIVSCQTVATPVTCMTVGSAPGSGNPVADLWNVSTTSWTSAAPPDGSGTDNSLSCASPTSCVVAGEQLPVQGGVRAWADLWNGSGWTVMNTKSVNSDPSANSTLWQSVSCPSSTFCVAAGQNGTVPGNAPESPEAASWGTAP
jgi:hypothetical protein